MNSAASAAVPDPGSSGCRSMAAPTRRMAPRRLVMAAAVDEQVEVHAFSSGLSLLLSARPILEGRPNAAPAIYARRSARARRCVFSVPRPRRYGETVGKSCNTNIRWPISRTSRPSGGGRTVLVNRGLCGPSGATGCRLRRWTSAGSSKVTGHRHEMTELGIRLRGDFGDRPQSRSATRVGNAPATHPTSIA